MKTKNLIWMMVMLIGSITLGACGKQEPVSPEGPRLMGQVFKLDYVFDAVLVPEDLEIKTFEHPVYDKEMNTPRTKVFLEFDGVFHSGRSNSSVVPKPLYELRRRVGDDKRPEHYSYANPFGHSALAHGLESISVEAVEPYNSQYPAQSSLNAIVEVTYHSWDETFFNKEMRDKGYLGGLTAYTRNLSEGLTMAKLIVPGLFMLDFKEAPSQPKVKLRFVVTFDDGTSLERTEELEIHEAK